MRFSANRFAIGLTGVCLIVSVSMLLGDGTDDAVPLIGGFVSQCSLNGQTVGGGCLVNGAPVCPGGGTPNGQVSSDACQPIGPQCQTPAAVRTPDPTPQIVEGRYRLKLDVHLDSGELDCLNSRTQDKHRMLQQIGCTANVVQSTFWLDQKDQQGFYTLRPAGESPNTVLGVWVDGDKRFIAEMGMKLSCRAGADQYHWNLNPRGAPAGRYKIQNKLTGQCISADLNNHIGSGGGSVLLVSCADVDAQFFNLEKVQ